ncbi:hypothetical protein HK104_007249, partial [Borealophlyctis nickersoniae]
DEEGAAGAAGFERNLVEIQRLLERAKNAEEKLYTHAPDTPDKPNKKRRADTQQQQQLFELHSGGTLGAGGGVGGANGDRVLAGRKPIRVIAAELAKRIETLKTNQAAWEAFQSTIMEYRASEIDLVEDHIDMIRLNKNRVHQYYHPEHRHRMLLEQKISHENHRHAVLEKKRLLDDEKLKRWNEALRKKDDATEAKGRKEKDEMGRAATLQKKWFILTIVASRLNMFRRFLEETHKAKRIAMIQNHAARVIQRAYRKFKTAEYEERKRKALMKIAGYE